MGCLPGGRRSGTAGAACPIDEAGVPEPRRARVRLLTAGLVHMPSRSGAAQQAFGDGAGGPLSGTAIAAREFGIPAVPRTRPAAAALTGGPDSLVLAHDHGRVVSACC